MRQLAALRGPTRKPGKAKRDPAQNATNSSPDDTRLNVGQNMRAELATKVCRTDADALFCPCTAWRAMEAAQELENRLGKPVITAVQATAWRTFHKVGLTDPIRGFGRLLELMPEPLD